jgi:hypothetical protein
MSLSVRTIHSHLEEIRTRLGFRNKAQLAAWAAVQGLASASEAARGSDLSMTPEVSNV